MESVRGAVPESATSDPGSETARFWRIPAGEIEQLAASRLRQWLLDDGSIYHAMGDVRLIRMEKRILIIGMMALMSMSGFFACTRTAFAASFTPSGMRAVPDPLYGVTVDGVSNVTNIVHSSTNLSHMPTTRIVFDYGQAPSAYTSAVSQIEPASYIMGELVDSADMTSLGRPKARARFRHRSSMSRQTRRPRSQRTRQRAVPLRSLSISAE